MSTMTILRVSYEMLQFEGQHKTLVDFTSEFLHVNRHRMKLPTRQEVGWYWEEQIMRFYPDSDDQKRVFLLEQVVPPA